MAIKGHMAALLRTRRQVILVRFKAQGRRRGIAFFMAVLLGLTLGAATPAFAVTAMKTNRVILAGGSWLGGGGVDVYSNDGDYNSASGDLNYVNGVLSGYRRQCVELVNRLYLTKGWISANWSGNGADMYNTAPSSLTKEANGAIKSVNAGDVIVFNGGWGGYG